MSVAIVTDSTADLPAALASEYGIDVVPLFVNFGERRYRDSIDLTHRDFYAMLAGEKALPTTSQPTAAMFEDVFRPHVAAGRSIVCLTITAGLSGTINAAQAAAAQFPDADIRLIDSGTVAGGLALLALHAATLARAGADAAAIAGALARDRAVQRGYASIPDLSHAVRSGRVSRTQAFIGSLVKIVPVLRIDSGKVQEEARVRTFARAQEAMIASAAAVAGDGDGAYLAVIHADVPDLARSVFDRVRSPMTGTPAYAGIFEAGPVLATHAGAGACAVFVIPR
ncbi:MAG: DegV family protein [Candidatus Velthaea sp.]